MEIKRSISREVLENVLVTALEGGSNYWYYLTDDAVKLVRKAVPKNEDPYLSTAILKAVLDHHIDIPINDSENEDDVLGYLSHKTMMSRLQELSQDKECMWALDRELEGQGDADSSDVVFQYIVMGECIFS
jgi:hypothetical protein